MGIEFIDRPATLLRTAETVAAVLDPAATPAGDLLAEIEEVLGNRTVGEVVHDAMFNDLAMSARLLRNVLVIWVRTWDQGGRESLLNLICVPATDTEDPMLVAAVRTLMALAACSERGEGGSTEEEDLEELDADGLARLGLQPPHMDVVELLDEMARLVQRDNPAGAAQILISALQLARDPAAGEEFAERAGGLAAQANAPELLETVALIRVNLAAANTDPLQPETRLAVLDAVHAVLRLMPNPEALGKDDLRVALLVDAAIRADLADELIPLMTPWIAPESERAGLRTDSSEEEKEAENALQFSTPIWHLPADHLGGSLLAVGRLAAALELCRARLEPSIKTESAQADWTTWSYRHPVLTRAVPHSDSFLHEHDLDDLRLCLHHETMHVLSMVGGLGLGVLALRAAAMEVELDLFSMTVPEDVASWVDRGLAPLEGPSMPLLCVAERSVEILCKMKVLQSIWNPWFEGLAVFGETADDPRSDEVMSPTAQILNQLVDDVPREGYAIDRKTRLLQALRHQEDTFHAAQERLGADRLGGYLTDYGPKYLAGYLAVRAVVATWRRHVPDLSGSKATRLLLFATRFGTFEDALPDLGLPFEEFATTAERKMLDWVAWLACLPAEEIRRGSTSSNAERWVGGRIVAVPEDNVGEVDDEEARRRFQELVAQALTSLRGHDRAPMDRVKGAEEETQNVMRVAAIRLASADPRPVLADNLLHIWTAQMAVLPLGVATAQYWLSESTRHLIYVIRVNEKRRETNRPRVDLGMVPLDQPQFEALVEAARTHPFDRLTVMRFADLDSRGLKGRGLGRNYIVFRLGDWLHIQPRGWVFGSKTVQPSLQYSVEARTAPPFASRLESRLLSPDGAAVRTARWTAPSRRNQWGSLGSWVIPWVEHVHELAVFAASPGESRHEQEASARLLAEVTGDPVVAERRIMASGWTLAPSGGSATFFELLFRSGFEPYLGVGVDFASDGPVLWRRNGLWDVRPMAGVVS